MTIPITLITGFLGSGKTTLLQHLAAGLQGQRIAILVNEFASLNIDGQRLTLAAGQKAVVITGGSIFCRCKISDLLSTMHGLLALDPPPEGILIEASGMADPRVLLRLLQETGLAADCVLRRVLAVVDPLTLPRLLTTLPALAYQIEAADTILINRCDCADASAIADALAEVRHRNPTAAVHLTTHARLDLDPFTAAAVPQTDGPYAVCHDPRYITHVLHPGPAGNPQAVADLLRQHATVVLRAKGQLNDGDGMVAVDWAGGCWHCTPTTSTDPPALVIIVDATATDGAAALAAALRPLAAPAAPTAHSHVSTSSLTEISHE